LGTLRQAPAAEGMAGKQGRLRATGKGAGAVGSGGYGWLEGIREGVRGPAGLWAV